MLPYKDWIAKSLEWLLKLSGPTLLATLLAWEDGFAKAIDTIPSIWRFRLLALLLSLSLGLAAWLILSRTKFVEYRGAFFKRKSGGGYHHAVYCGACKLPAAIDSRAQFLDLQFRCKCGWVSSFSLGEFNEFLPNIQP